MKADEFDSVKQQLGGVSRRDFLKFCSVIAVGMGLPLSAGARIAEAITSVKRPPVIWLSFQECTGCVESLLRSTHPTLEHLILDLISLDYSETLSAAAGRQAEAAKDDIHQGKQGQIHPGGGRRYSDQRQGHLLQDRRQDRPAKSCTKQPPRQARSWPWVRVPHGAGIAAAGSNPTEAKGVPQILAGKNDCHDPGLPAEPL